MFYLTLVSWSNAFPLPAGHNAKKASPAKARVFYTGAPCTVYRFRATHPRLRQRCWRRIGVYASTVCDAAAGVARVARGASPITSRLERRLA